MTNYKTTPLFGGAIVCDLPEHFADVSRLRQVPDHQEVYIDKDGFTSIIVEITERVGPDGPTSLEEDGRALTTHLEELVGDDVDTVKVWNTTETRFSKLEYVFCYFLSSFHFCPAPAFPTTTTPTTIQQNSQQLTNFKLTNSPSISAYTLIATQTPKQSDDSDSRRSSRQAPDFTALILTLVRLEREKTDILITINVPHIKGEYDEEDVDLALGKQGALLGRAVEYAAKIWETFEVKDWGLFKEL